MHCLLVFGFTSANVLVNTLDATDSDVTGTFGEGTTSLTVGTLDNLTIDAGILLDSSSFRIA
ncbi:MAG: hypothetical protein IPP01_10225 [Saprospiraceae bacterium]|nr:hypothetical protein [Saprospiraceae bacterium]